MDEKKKGDISKLEEEQARELLKVKISAIRDGSFVPDARNGLADIRMMDEVINSKESEKSLFDKLFDRVFPPIEGEEAERSPDSKNRVRSMEWPKEDGSQPVSDDASAKEDSGSPSEMIRAMKYKQSQEK